VVNSSSIKQLIDSAIGQLVDSSSPRLDAEILLSHVLKKSRSFLYARPEYLLSPAQQREFAELLQQRSGGEPVAYLTGEKEFWSLPLRVSRDTLIPRPETEGLVYAALELGAAMLSDPLRVIDLGTGSGCIALALAHERTDWEITAVDHSDAALSIAQENAERLGIKKIRWLRGNWLENVDSEPFDLIVSNPPYIAAGDVHLQQGDVRFEPRTALIGGDNGLAAFTDIARQSRTRLREHSRLLFEIGHDQAERVRELLADLGYTGIEFRKDLNGIDRVCIAQININHRGAETQS
jgi:release factor glutamine methyltransferase